MIQYVHVLKHYIASNHYVQFLWPYGAVLRRNIKKKASSTECHCSIPMCNVAEIPHSLRYSMVLYGFPRNLQGKFYTTLLPPISSPVQSSPQRCLCLTSLANVCSPVLVRQGVRNRALFLCSWRAAHFNSSFLLWRQPYVTYSEEEKGYHLSCLTLASVLLWQVSQPQTR